jgi:acyl-CoA synthetase (NDP forming)
MSAGPVDSALDLRGLLAPRSVAIVGASDRGDSPGARLTAALLRSGYDGEIFAVNPRKLDLPGTTWLPSVDELDEPVDLAALAVAAAASVEALEVLAARGARAAVIYSSGYGESGPEGAELERRLVEIARASGMAVCGPNTAGIISMPSGFLGSFTHAVAHGMPASGSLMVVTQSGAIGGLTLARLRERGVGISHWISVGNGAVLDVPDYLEYAAEDPATDSIALFIEGVNDGARFRSAVERCRERGKLVFAFKAGSSTEGARAAASHTGKLAGADAVYSGLLRQYGVERVGSLSELADLAMARSWLPHEFGPRGAVLSISGAGCTILADELSHAGLALASLSEETGDRMSERLPSYGQKANPVDLTGKALIDPTILRDVTAAALDDPGVDFVIVSFATNVQPEFAHAIDEAWNREKPLVAILPMDHAGGEPMRAVLGERRIPSFQDFKPAAQVLRRLATGEAPRVNADATVAHNEQAWLGGTAVLELLAAHGIRIPRASRGATPEEAAGLAAEIGGTVVVKVDHPEVLHKTEVGGVRVGVAAADVADVCRAMQDAIEGLGIAFAPAGGFLVQEQVTDATEVLVGLVSDPTFGPVLSLGPGGTLVEFFDQVAFRGMPFSEADVHAALRETPLGRLLAEHRQGPRDTASLVALVLGFQALVLGDDPLLEGDLNPVLVRADGQGCVVVDARLRRLV